MKRQAASVAFTYIFLTVLPALSQQPGPALSIDASVNVHPISPDIYGIDFYWDLPDPNDPGRAAAEAIAANVRATARRWGGDNTSSYHWKFDVSNLDSDWFFQVL